jgi:hypothetical protein
MLRKNFQTTSKNLEEQKGVRRNPKIIKSQGQILGVQKQPMIAQFGLELRMAIMLADVVK